MAMLIGIRSSYGYGSPAGGDSDFLFGAGGSPSAQIFADPADPRRIYVYDGTSDYLVVTLTAPFGYPFTGEVQEMSRGSVIGMFEPPLAVSWTGEGDVLASLWSPASPGLAAAMLAGDDSLHGSEGADVLRGYTGNDELRGRGGSDSLYGGAGEDLLIASSGSSGPWESPDTAGDFLDGGEGNDALLGGVGNDTLNGGTGVDSMEGGEGDDVFIVDDVYDMVAESEGPSGGVDEIRTSAEGYRLQEVSSYSYYSSRSSAWVEILTGTSDAGQHLLGNSLGQRIVGAAGNDTIIGNGGADTLVGGAGDDYIRMEDPWSYGPSSYVGSVVEGGAGGDYLVGGVSDDTIAGGDGYDLIRGGYGQDTLLYRSLTEGGDIIYDFDAADRIMLDAAGFGVADPSTVAFRYADDPVTGPGPAVVYSASSGSLWFEPGDAGSGGFMIATLGDYSTPPLTAGGIVWC